jgi:hypothetical protein
MGIIRIVSIIAHHEDAAFRDDDLWHRVCGLLHNEWFVARLAIEKDLAVLDLHIGALVVALLPTETKSHRCSMFEQWHLRRGCITAHWNAEPSVFNV